MTQVTTLGRSACLDSLMKYTNCDIRSLIHAIRIPRSQSLDSDILLETGAVSLHVVCSHSNNSRDKFLDPLRLSRPSVRLTSCEGSTTNTDSGRKNCWVRLLRYLPLSYFSSNEASHSSEDGADIIINWMTDEISPGTWTMEYRLGVHARLGAGKHIACSSCLRQRTF